MLGHTVNPKQLRGLDLTPVRFNPLAERIQWYLEGSTETSQLIKSCRFHALRVKAANHKAFTLGASQRVGEYLVGDSIEPVAEFLVTPIGSG